MRKSILAGVLLIAATSQAVMAFQLPPQTQTWSFDVSPNATDLVFNQFNDQGGALTLTKVTLIIDGTIHATLSAQNTSTLDEHVSFLGVGAVSANAPGFGPTNAAFSYDSGPVLVQAGETKDFGTATGLAHSSSSIQDNLSSYIGAGEVTIPVTGTGGFAITVFTNTTPEVSNFGTDGVATLIYEYTPEPASLLGLMASGLVFFRRRR